ncbi:fimbria/pilus periplasmic chaperone [Cupriavidus basilensis]|uniref:fimbria/pilus periplasmic chaperone n=1 Tax=Cupriavidus sp. SK-3 TaxID=1470558 RepID=UPI00044654CD|nr:fimbria/pilus periplasmic chaperone [Cupriavidus sp. SK-3]KDP86737.1 pilus assembly protein [Cupriavidus sp. SK-3]
MTLSIPKSKLSRVMAIVSASIVSASIASTAAAAVVVSGTRVIFPAEEREMTIKVTNDGRLPSLVQTWIDVGNENDSPDKIDVPFTLTPTMFRVEPGKGQTLRIIYTNEPLPTDKESLFWLNVLDVPPKPTAEDERNRLQVAFRTRIKLMYRPAGLPGKVDEAPALLKWHIARDPEANQYVLKTVNPSPYVVSLGSVQLKVGGKTFDAGMGYVRPGGSQTFPIKGLESMPAAEATIEYSSIDDWGGNKNAQVPVATDPRN